MLDQIKSVLEIGALTLGKFEVTVGQLAAALVAVVLGFLLRRIARAVLDRLRRITDKTKTAWDDIVFDAIEKPLGFAFIVAGVGAALLLLDPPEAPVNIKRFVEAGLRAMAAVIVVWFALRLIDGVALQLQKIAAKTESKLDDQVLPILRTSAKVFAVLIGAMVIVQNLGYSIGSLLAGLGLGGAAIALASKDTVANLFGSLVIFIDRPFQIGDWVAIGSIEGTVEEVGLRTTRIRTFANSLITLPNHLLTTSSIENWSAMQKRRISVNVGVTYGTSPSQMNELVKRFRKVLENDDRILQDFFLVNFNNFGPSSLDVFVYCFTKTTNWAEYLQVRQEVFLEFMKVVDELGLSFAFPSQSLYLEKVPESMPTALAS